ncbi:nucleoside hydrolase [Candidatus Purcelliella pentastirinorum]|uniref:Nucleoside hydrolase n=1 Tax=Candidatus Purcelliella pentastirinorum TaxID=472834 RepID=A0AAX3N8E2_9ENTR|nr:nucleoside hydrolase [Candidatus Purcelliella pentastirinorum]WDI78367.1 nucleoside hydrolase [Candidatus Purcelliella pentastirinorum]WDR80606.1 nucleoside hydrolase [Candidatus Purcelliella pentastirinorum]
MNKIIFDTDIGVDDAFALLLAYRTQNILGITTVFGNTNINQVTNNAVLFSKKFDIDVPIYKGCSNSLVYNNSFDDSINIHGNNGLGDIFDDYVNYVAYDALEFIIDSINNNPYEIILVALGPLTNIATVIKKCPELVPKIKFLIIMGGAFGTNGCFGNITCNSEFNVWSDPHAAQLVFLSKLPIVVVPLDVTHKIVITEDDLFSLNNNFLIDLSRCYMSFYKNKKFFDGMVLHDPIVISYLIEDKWFDVKDVYVEVLTDTLYRGSTLMFDKKYDYHNILHNNDNLLRKVCLNLDVVNVKSNLLNILKI